MAGIVNDNDSHFEAFEREFGVQMFDVSYAVFLLTTFMWNFNPLWIIDSNAKAARCVLHHWKTFVGSVVVLFWVNQAPFVSCKISGFYVLDFAESIVFPWSLAAVSKKRWRIFNFTLDLVRLGLHRYLEIFKLFGVQNFVDGVDHSCHSLLGMRNLELLQVAHLAWIWGEVFG